MTKQKEIFLNEYLPSQFFIESTDLEFDIHEDFTHVVNTMKFSKNPQTDHTKVLELHGEDLELICVKYNGENFTDYVYENDILTLTPRDNEFSLVIENKNFPKKNKALMGLYVSGDILCTQCEAEGFRRITFFLDRPDVLSKFTTTITADAQKFPNLLSNGNLIREEIKGARKTCVWEDPFNKPAYLFALVAGDLDLVEDFFETKSGRKVKLEIYVDKGKKDQVPHAMNCLKQSMKWDEDRFDLEYDLDIYMIVAVDSFNMGAMENKGLNIFNSKYVLGNEVTATDEDYYGIQAVIGHEYFHNWTGNRVTCRDWFQLTLKEGLTVFRDREFSSDLNSRAVKRIDDVANLRASQFVEDAGPFSHPIKPKSYVEINNFYTSTIYEKGAEVIGMIHTLIGEKNFQKGMKIYFEKFDGTAATTEDFVSSMQEASGYDLTHFSKWYDISGTPLVKLEVSSEGVKVSQDKGLEMPLCFKFLDNGQKSFDEYELQAKKSEVISRDGEEILILRDDEVFFKITNPIISFNRNFSAPIRLKRNDDTDQLILKDDDSFSVWDYGQTLWEKAIFNEFRGSESSLDAVVEVCLGVLKSKKFDNHFKAYFLSLPSVSVLNEKLEVYDFEGIYQAREKVKCYVAKKLQDTFKETYQNLRKENQNIWNDEMMGLRALENSLLSFLSLTEYSKLVKEQFENSPNMTNKLCALGHLNSLDLEGKQEANLSFSKMCEKYDQLGPGFFAAMMRDEKDTLKTLKSLLSHPLFKPEIPNYLYRLYGTVLSVHSHKCYTSSSEILKFVLTQICEIDKSNPQVASRFFKALKNPMKFDKTYQAQYLSLLQNINSQYSLSKDSQEVISKFLGKS